MNSWLLRRLITLITLIIFAAGICQAKGTDARAYVPVQAGFVQQADAELPYAPDRILVKFKDGAMNPTMRAIPLRRGAGALNGKMNVKSVDALAQAHGVVSAVRPYRSVTNPATAKAYGFDRWFMYRFKGNPHLPDVVKAFQADPNVEAASLDWKAYPMVQPLDPDYPSQWGHNNTGQLLAADDVTGVHSGPAVGTPGFDSHAEEAWEKVQGFGSSAVTIAILDSGVDMNHEDLNLLPGYDFGDDDDDPQDDSLKRGHGTACAGIAAAVANNGLGVSGIAGGVRILPCKVSDSGGSIYLSYVQDALVYAANQGADVISMSFGANITSEAGTDAKLVYAYNAGCLLLAATGNENADTISYPANHPVVMGIGAASPCGERKRSSDLTTKVNPGVNTDPLGVTCDNEFWWGSNYGPNVQDDRGAVDLIAPTIMPTTDITGSGGYSSGNYSMWFNGTSCSTPYAAGVAALVISANPGMTNAEVWDAMTLTATDIVTIDTGGESVAGWDRYTGYGMVNADAAIGNPDPIPPIADFIADPVSGFSPLDVSFIDLSTGIPTSWTWNFGDGSLGSNQQNPVHTYTVAGNYTVTLTATNSEGSGVRTKSNYILVGDGTASFVPAEFESSIVGELVDGTDFTDTWALDGTDEVISEEVLNIRRKQTSAAEHYWRFILPDGDATFHMTAARPPSAEGESFEIAYSTGSSTYTPLFTINSEFINDYSASIGQVSGEIWIRAIDTNRKFDYTVLDQLHIDYMAFEMQGLIPTPPIADFSSNTTSGNLPLTVYFTDESSGEPTEWDWDFGDTSSSINQNPSHTYNSKGTYTVKLTASNAYGSDVEEKVAYITVTEPAPGPAELFVPTMIPSRRRAGPNYIGVCDIQVIDNQGNPMDGARVFVDYDGPNTGSTNGLTVNGWTTVETNPQKKPEGGWCFTVTKITYDSTEYIVTKVACE